MSATIKGNNPLAISLNPNTKKAHIFNGLHSASLISLCQLCDDDCVSILDNNEINILKGRTLILKGQRNKTDELWDITISRPVRHRAMEITTKDKTKTELFQYLHGCYFRSTPRNLTKEIKNGNFLTCPGLNNQQLLKHLPPSIATALEHMDQERKNLQSTKHVKPEVEVEEDRNFYPDTESVKIHEICATIIPFNLKRKGFSDITGAFPHKSSRGNVYVMVMYDHYSNAILAEPIKNIQTATIRDDFLKVHTVLKEICSNPIVYITDNECSSNLKEVMKKYEIDFQLDPPHMHR